MGVSGATTPNVWRLAVDQKQLMGNGATGVLGPNARGLAEVELLTPKENAIIPLRSTKDAIAWERERELKFATLM